MRFNRRTFGLAVALATGTITIPAFAQEKTYNVALFSDFSGPFANIMRPVHAGREAVFAWWNAEVGKDLGVQIGTRTYDTRYDAAQAASLWPGILSELNPLIIGSTGSTDIAALSQRLPEDKVVMMAVGGATHAGWVDDSWVFFPRATYAHEYGGFLNWFYETQGRSEPIRVGLVGSQQALLTVDLHDGIQAFISENPDKAAMVDVIWDAPQPTDLTAPMRRMVNAGAEVIFVNSNTATVVATKRALQALGANIPIVTSSHNSLPTAGQTLGGLDQVEGDFEVYGMAVATEDATGPAREFYDLLASEYGLEAPWGVLTLQGIAQAILSVRSIEAAINAYGPDDLTGEKVREVLITETAVGNMGVIPDFSFTADATFPTEGATVNIGTVRDGRYTTAASDVPLANVKRW
ncbi:ABC transporter substrate-binding protein [Mesorhizobium microcysteis]|uniref:ABC transporter substrate-binding protein n=1 Tax=Neoaquamicrobium microcysteis TaxID=2682781 RepID=A0A5D4H0G0_9HYPH|nr:ABC transporter substrate-binding protein [Mesorhizobium microcysteis]TYR33529.1 ABC transporter substrate-binding protein [Mesorhizobium microcysteis]